MAICWNKRSFSQNSRKKIEILFWICFESDQHGQEFSENCTVNTKLPIFVCSYAAALDLHVVCLHSPEACISSETLLYLPCPNIQVFKKQISSETVILTPFQKLQLPAYLDYLEKQPRLDDDGHLVLGRVLARDAPEERIPHGARALHRFLQPRLLPDGAGGDPPRAENALGLLKSKHANLHLF